MHSGFGNTVAFQTRTLVCKTVIKKIPCAKSALQLILISTQSTSSNAWQMHFSGSGCVNVWHESFAPKTDKKELRKRHLGIPWIFPGTRGKQSVNNLFLSSLVENFASGRRLPKIQNVKCILYATDNLPEDSSVRERDRSITSTTCQVRHSGSRF